jgi:hypothetical protein
MNPNAVSSSISPPWRAQLVHEYLAAVRVWGTYLEDNVEVKNCATAQYRCGTDAPETALVRSPGQAMEEALSLESMRTTNPEISLIDLDFRDSDTYR